VCGGVRWCVVVVEVKSEKNGGFGSILEYLRAFERIIFFVNSLFYKTKQNFFRFAKKSTGFSTI
jgi:hypothetical protein